MGGRCTFLGIKEVGENQRSVGNKERENKSGGRKIAKLFGFMATFSSLTLRRETALIFFLSLWRCLLIIHIRRAISELCGKICEKERVRENLENNANPFSINTVRHGMICYLTGHFFRQSSFFYA